MDPELRYGRAYVPRTNYSYITTTNLARNRTKPSTRTYSQPAPSVNRDWTPSTTNWMPKRDWYYGAYEDLYAPSSSLKSRLKSEDTNVSRRRLNDDINYELNRFKPPHLASIASYPVKKHRTWEHDDWQDKMDLLYPYTQNLSYRDALAKDNYSGTRLSRREAHNNERLNDLNYDYNVLRRSAYQTPRYSRFYSQGALNDYPALPRSSIYTPISKQPSLYDDVGHYMFPSAYPRNLAPLKDMSYLDTHEDWLKTMSHDLYPPRRYFNYPEPYRAKSSVRDNYSSSSYRPRSSAPDYSRGKSFSPIRRTPVKSYPAPSYPAYQKTPVRSYSPAPARKSYKSEPDADYTPRPRKTTTFDDEPVSTRPRPRREISPPAERPARAERQQSKPADDDEDKPKARPRFEPDNEEPNLERRRIPSVRQDEEPELSKPASKRPSVTEDEEPSKPASKRPSVTEVKEATPTPSPRQSVADEAEPEPSAPATPRRSVTESLPASKAPTPKASITETPRASVAQTPRESVAETPRASVAQTPRESVAQTPRESVAESPRQSVSSSQPSRPKSDGNLGLSTSKSPKPSVTDGNKDREPSPGPSEAEVFEDEASAEEEPEEDREATPVPEADAEEEEVPAEEEREPSPAPADEEPAQEEEPIQEEEPAEEEEAPTTPQKKINRVASAEFIFDENAEEAAPVDNGDADHADENEEEEQNGETTMTRVQTGQTTTTKITTTTTETTYEEEEVEEYEETVEENGTEELSQLEYGEEEDLNAQSIKERGYSRENSTGSQVNGDEEEEEE